MDIKPRHFALQLISLLLIASVTSTKPMQADEVVKVSPVGKPILQIDTGGHKATIRDVIFTRDGKYLISASDDKTMRVWDVISGEVVRVIRGHIGQGNDGQLFAAALSPNNRLLAVGGWLHPECEGQCGNIRLIDFQTGEILGLLKGHTNVILGLTFSPDSRRLLSGSFDDTARIWDVTSGKSLHVIEEHSDHIYAVAFSPDGDRVVTGSDDDTLKLWNSTSGELLADMKGHEGDVVTADFTPDGTYILSGSRDKTIRLWDGQSGEFIKVLARQETEIDDMTISADGTKVLTGHGCCISDSPNNVFSIPSGELLSTFAKHDNVVVATDISPDDMIAATGGGGNQTIYLWDIKTGEVKKRIVGRGENVWSVGFAKDGKSIAWGKTWGAAFNGLFGWGPLEQSFQIKEGLSNSNLTLGKAILKNSQSERHIPPSHFLRAIDSVGDLSITTQNDYIDPTLLVRKNGSVIHRITRDDTTGYSHLSLTFTPDGSAVISGGSNGILTSYNPDTAEKIRDFVGHTDTVWGVAVSPDSRHLVSGSNDQTVRLWEVASGKLLLTIFQGSDGEWVAWTPTGFYTASSKGDAYVGYHINRGEDKAADYVGLDQVGDRFYRPDLVAKTVQGGYEQEIIAELARIGTIDEIIADGLPPQIRLLSESDQDSKQRNFTLSLAVKAFDGGIGEVRYRVNGTEVASATARGEALVGLRRSGVIEEDELVIEKSLTLPDGESIITASICNSDNTICSREVTLTRHVDDPHNKQPSLHLLAIGITNYRDRSLQLAYADKDAEALSKSLKQRGVGLYKNIYVTPLLNEQATTEGIEQAFKQIATQVEANDVFALYLAGHGMARHGEYYFVPREAVYENSEAIAEASISKEELNVLLKQIPTSKSLLILDSCSSGLFAATLAGDNQLAALSRGMEEKTAIDRLMRATGRTVLAATTDRAQALEGHEGHGVFTWALLEGLKGRADRKGDGEGTITLDELSDFVRDEVPEITLRKWGYEQIPMRVIQGDTFPIGCKEGYDKSGCRK